MLPPGCETDTRGLRSLLLKAELELLCCVVAWLYISMHTLPYVGMCLCVYLQLDEGEVPMTQATAPATAGVAMEVPDMLWVFVCP